MIPHPSVAVSRRALLTTAAAAPAAVALPGCSGDRGAAVRSGTDHVTMLTSFGLFGRDAYPFVAVEQGFFADADLDVEIQPGGGTQPNLQQLLGGQAHFALIDLSGAIIARGAGTTGTPPWPRSTSSPRRR